MRIYIVGYLLFIGMINCRFFCPEAMGADIEWLSKWQKLTIGDPAKSITGLYPVQDGKYVLAGTSLGLSIFTNPFPNGAISKTIPLNNSVAISKITGFTESNDKKRVACIGYTMTMQSFIFIAEAIDSTPFYRVKQMLQLQKARFLASTGNGMDTLYAGCDDKISFSVKQGSGEMGPFQPIEATNNCFGSLKPVCTGLIYYRDSSRLYATGFDSSTNTPKNFYLINGNMVPFSPALPYQNIYVTHLRMVRTWRDNTTWPFQTLYVSHKDTIGYRYASWSNWKPHKIIITKTPLIDFSVAGTPQPTDASRQDGINYIITALADTFLYYGIWNTVKSLIPASDKSILLQCIASMPELSDLHFNCYIGTNKGVYYNQGNVIGTSITTSASHKKRYSVHFAKVRNSAAQLRINNTVAGQVLMVMMYSIKGELLYSNDAITCDDGNTFVSVPVGKAGFAHGRYIACIRDAGTGVRLFFQRM